MGVRTPQPRDLRRSARLWGHRVGRRVRHWSCLLCVAGDGLRVCEACSGPHVDPLWHTGVHRTGDHSQQGGLILQLNTTIIMLPPRRGIKRRCCLTSVCMSVCLTDVCLSVAYIGPKSRTERPRKTKIGTEVSHVTRDSDTTFKVKRSKVSVTGAGHIVAASRTACYYCRILCLTGLLLPGLLTPGSAAGPP